MKKALLLLLPILIGGLYFLLEDSKERVFVPFNIQKELQKRANKEFLENNIQKELKSNNIQEATTLVNLASYLHIDINTTLLQHYKKQEANSKTLIHQGKEFLDGFITGNITSSASLAGALSSDFSIIGDLRDIYQEGNKYLSHQPYDKFILSLSLASLALTFATVPSFGTTLPLKAATTTLKGAKKSKYLTQEFVETLEQKLSQATNLEELKKIDFTSLQSIKQSKIKLAKLINLKPLKPIFQAITTIQKNSSTLDTIKILRFVHNEKELKRAAFITKKYKKNSYGVLKVLGKKAFQTTKLILKKGTYYFLILFMLTLTLAIWLLSLFIVVYHFFTKK